FDEVHAWNPCAIERVQPIWAELQQMRPRRLRIAPQPSDVNPVAHRRECFQKADAVVELDRRAAKVVLVEQVMQTDANLEDALIQVAYLRGGGAPQQLERFVLL